MNNSSVLDDNSTYYVSLPPGSELISSTVQIYVNGIFACVIFLLNLITTISVLISKTVTKKDKVSLSVITSTNASIGFQIMCVRLIPAEYTSENVLCSVRLHTAVMFAFIIIFSNVMLTLERFLCIVMPLNYKLYVTWKHLLGCSIGILLFAIVLSWTIYNKTIWSEMIKTEACLLSLGSPTGFAIMGFMMCFASVLNTVLYAYITKVARRQISQIAATMVGGNTPYTRNTFVTRQEIRLTFTVGINTVAFVVSYFPLGAYVIYYGGFSREPDRNVFVSLITLFLFNSLLNPVVYIWRLRSCRQEMIEKICGPCRPAHRQTI